MQGKMNMNMKRHMDKERQRVNTRNMDNAYKTHMHTTIMLTQMMGNERRVAQVAPVGSSAGLQYSLVGQAEAEDATRT